MKEKKNTAITYRTVNGALAMVQKELIKIERKCVTSNVLHRAGHCYHDDKTGSAPFAA